LTNFLKFSTVINFQFIPDAAFPFPPVQICLVGGLNQSYITTEFWKVFYPALCNDARIHRFADRLQCSVDDIIYGTFGYMTMPPEFAETWYDDRSKIYDQVIYKGISAFGSSWPGYRTFYEEGRYECDQVLSNCKLNGINFPCCSNGSTYGVSDITCYELNVSVVGE
jgi:hypothetical protein